VTRHHRTITVDFQDEATYLRLLNDGKALVKFVLAFILALSFQLTRHSRYVRVRLGGSPSGASSVHGAKPSSRSFPPSSSAIARGDPRGRTMPC
jgi:hypothetical protein